MNDKELSSKRKRWYDGYSIQLMIIIGELAFIAGVLCSLASRL